MAFQQLSNILWRERHLLEHLVFKLETEHALLAANRTRWINKATDEVNEALDDLRRAELERHIVASGVAIELGLEPDASLRELAAIAGDPWRSLLLEHADAFIVLMADVETWGQANRELLSRGQRSLQDLLDGLGDGLAVYATSGSARSAPSMIDGRL